MTNGQKPSSRLSGRPICWFAGIACAVTVAASCMAMTSCEATPTATPSRPIAANYLGDVPTLDPCSVMNPAELGSIGTVSVRTFSLHGCVASITSSEAGKTRYIGIMALFNVAVAFDGKRPNDSPIREIDSAQLLSLPMFQDVCARVVVFPDESAVEVLPDLNLKDYDCPTSDAVAESIVHTVESGMVRHWTLPPDSYGAIDTCGMIRLDQIRQFNARIADLLRPSGAKENCKIGADDGPLVWIRVDPHSAADPIVPTDLAPSPPEQISGRTSYVWARSGLPKPTFALNGPSCWVATIGRKWEPGQTPGGVHLDITSPQIEEALVIFYGSSSQDLCGAARGIASWVWSKLPRT